MINVRQGNGMKHQYNDLISSYFSKQILILFIKPFPDFSRYCTEVLQ